MSLIVEVNEDGALILPPEAVGNAKPHARFILRKDGENLLLQPENEPLLFGRQLRRRSAPNGLVNGPTKSVLMLQFAA